MPRCSIVVPVSNRAARTRQCLDVLLAQPPVHAECEIIVVDDGSTDRTPAVVAGYGDQLRICRHRTSRGFAAAANAGAAIAAGDFLIFLTDDLLPAAGWLDALVRHAQLQSAAAIVGSKIVLANDVVQQAGVVFGHDRLPRRLYAGLPADHPAVNLSRRFQAVSGWGALIRRAAFERVKGFDTVFPDVYCDVDLCLRLADHGAHAWYCHESVLEHLAPGMSDGWPAGAADDAAFLDRWRQRVQPDDAAYYMADDLLRLHYRPHLPAELDISPLLAVVTGEERERRADRLLGARARQVFRLLADNAHLADRVREAEFRATADLAADATPADGSLTRATIDAMQTLGRLKLDALRATGAKLALPAPERPLVSIIVAAPREAHHLCLVLDGLVSGTAGGDWEVIVAGSAHAPALSALAGHLDHARYAADEGGPGRGDLLATGVELARGEYICLLLDGLLVLPGWLDALLATVQAASGRCAATGAIVRPDGRLHSAGGIVWQDGSISRHGEGQDARAPEYRHLREIDSAAAGWLLVRRDHLTAIGPVGSRDGGTVHAIADICLALRERGHPVVYQPRAMAVDPMFNGVPAWHSFGARPSSAFVAAWQHRLREQPPPDPAHILRARDGRDGRRILVMDDRVPLARFGQGYPRTRALLDALIALDYVVTYLPLADSRPHEPATGELQQRGVEVLHGAVGPRARLAERAGLYEAVIVSRPHNAVLIDAITAAQPTAAVIYDAEAVYARRDRGQALVEGTPLSEVDLEARLRAELAPVDAADVVLAVSEVEAALIRERCPRTPVIVWGYPVAIRPTRSDVQGRRDILFVGNLSTAPNADAIGAFLSDGWPAIERQIGCRLLIGGGGAAARLVDAARRGPSVAILGSVDDLQPVYDQARVFVAPHRFAGGIPLKVIEAMAHGVPCVLTPVLADQLGLTDGVEALIAPAGAGFTAQVVRLYQDVALWQRLQHAAWNFVDRRFNPRRLHDALRACIEQAIARKPRTSHIPYDA